MTDHEILLAMSTMLDPIRDSIQAMNTDLQDVKSRVRNIELTQENIIIPRLSTIESCYTSTYERYKNSVDDYESIKQNMPIIKQILREHSRKLQAIP